MKKDIEDIKAKKNGILLINRKDIMSSSSTKPRRGSIRSETHSFEESAEQKEENIKPRTTIPRTIRVQRARAPRLRTPLLIALVIALIGGSVYAISTVFENAKVIIDQKHQTFALDHLQFTASKDPAAPLHFEIMIVSDTQYKEMTLTQSENVSLKAQGTITMYNAYSTKAQTIGAHTYVADTSGKTYLTNTAVTIPGYTINKADKTTIIPGIADVAISAFLPGASYNGAPTDFTITAFKNSAKYTKIYAKAKTMLTGGAQGLIYTLSPEDQGALDAQAQSAFKDSLMKKVVAQVPDGYMLYNTAMQFTYNIDDTFNSPTADAKIPIDGSIAAVIIKKDDLAQALIKNLLPQATDKEVAEIQLEDMENLTYDFLPATQAVTKDTQTVGFTLTGTLHAHWNPDVGVLRMNLSGAPYNAVTSLLQTDPGIANASVKLFPPWESRLPTDSTKVHIQVR